MKKLLVILFFTFLAGLVKAQNGTATSNEYKTAIGIKLWDGAGLNLKTFLSDKTALEFIGFFNSTGTRITGLYEIHGNLSTEGNLKWYIGFGGHASFYKKLGTGGGIDGVLGVDYKFNNMPLNLALDWQPSVEVGVSTLNGFVGSYGGLAIRYTL
jgi:hypothetical protein